MNVGCEKSCHCKLNYNKDLRDACAVHILQLKHLRLELHNAIAHSWTHDSCLVAKPYVPVNDPSSQQRAHRIALKPAATKS